MPDGITGLHGYIYMTDLKYHYVLISLTAHMVIAVLCNYHINIACITMLTTVFVYSQIAQQHWPNVDSTVVTM